MTQLKELYEELIRGFNSKPSDLKKCTVTLNKLKVSRRDVIQSLAHSPH